MLDEVFDQEDDVVAAGPERRQRDVHHVQPVEQVGAEVPGARLGLEVAVGGGDQPDVDRDRAARAERRDLAVLEGAQELRLEREGDLRDLVEKERAAFGGPEDAVVVGHRAREGAAAVAEELAVEERL